MRYTVSFFLPFLLLFATTLLPVFVFALFKNPWVLLRFLFLG